MNIIIFTKTIHFTYLYYNVITRNYRKSHSESFTLLIFLFGCQIKRKFVHQKLVSEFIITFSFHSEFTKENILIHTPNVNSHGPSIRISSDENLRYIVLFKTFPSMWFHRINRTIQNVSCNVIWSNPCCVSNQQKSTFILFCCYEHQTIRDVKKTPAFE